MRRLERFISARNRRGGPGLSALSLYSGAGLSDLGYELAGFRFKVQCELDDDRAELGERNFPHSKWIVGNVQDKLESIVRAYRRLASGQRLSLLSITPPCQGMSSSNPGRGKMHEPKESDVRNTLLLEALPIVQRLKPRIVVAENVAPLLNRKITWHRRTLTVVQAFAEGLEGYHLRVGVVEMADYGIPQMRKRLILIALHEDEPVVERLGTQELLPWPRPTHADTPVAGQKPWITIRQWLTRMGYPELDSRTHPADPDLPLHFVPEYAEDDHRYDLVSSIRRNSGRNAYANSRCPICRRNGIREKTAYCPHCDEVLFNRPVVQEDDGTWRLIKGFGSSYRRAHPARPAPTVTTNSSHVGSDNKIHPWEHRVMSVLECADLQTVPRFFDWTWALETRHNYVIRNVVGEALPPYFTYLHGKVLRDLLAGVVPRTKLSRIGVDGQERNWRDKADEDE